MKTILMIAALALLGGCYATIHKSPTEVTIKYERLEGALSDVQEHANAHCGQFGKAAKLVEQWDAIEWPQRYARFTCTTPTKGEKIGTR